MTSPLLACLSALFVLWQAKSGWAAPLPTEAPEIVDTCNRLVDVAIVGAGPSGTYFAYKLRDTRLNIELFEYSNRIGGRLYTSSLSNVPGLNLELGGMRYLKGIHKVVDKVVDELGLTSKVFTEGLGRPERERFYLRGKSLTYYDLMNGTIPYNLNREEKENQDNLLSYFLDKLTGYNTTGSHLPQKEIMKLRLKDDGTELYKLTYNEALDLVATQEGKAFITDTNIFESEVVPNTCAINVFDEQLGEYSVNTTVLTPVKGMSAIPKTLAERFVQASLNHKVTMNRQLKGIRERGFRLFPYMLMFEETRTDEDGYTQSLGISDIVCARRVILAIPTYALSQLDWEPLRHDKNQKALNAVTPMHASKVFMTFSDAWWLGPNVENPANVTMSQLPFSQMYDWSHSNLTGHSVYAMLASYADVNHTDQLYKDNEGDDLIHGSAPGVNRVTKKLKDEILDELAVAFGINRTLVPEPLSAISQWWTSYPFGGGWTEWNPGHNFNDIRLAIRRPSLTQDIFVVGADHAFGASTAWTEGALETVEEVFDAYFRLTPF